MSLRRSSGADHGRLSPDGLRRRHPVRRCDGRVQGIDSRHGGRWQPLRRERRRRASRAVHLHAPRRLRCRAGDRPAPGVRRHLRRPGLRRGPDRPGRGHDRLRRRRRHRRAGRHRAELPHPGAARPRRRRAPGGALRLRKGPGQGDQARAAASARRSRRYPSRCWSNDRSSRRTKTRTIDGENGLPRARLERRRAGREHREGPRAARKPRRHGRGGVVAL